MEARYASNSADAYPVNREMIFNINKRQILQVGSRNIQNDYELCVVKILDLDLDL